MPEETREEKIKRFQRYLRFPTFGYEMAANSGDKVETDIYEWSISREIECPRCKGKAFCVMYLKMSEYHGGKQCSETVYQCQSFHYCPECNFLREGVLQKKSWLNVCIVCAHIWDFKPMPIRPHKKYKPRK